MYYYRYITACVCLMCILCRVLALDLTETAMAEANVEKATQLFGHVDMLVNNAGIAQRGLFNTFELDVERRLFEVDFFGQVALTKALLPCTYKSIL